MIQRLENIVCENRLKDFGIFGLKKRYRGDAILMFRHTHKILFADFTSFIINYIF